MNSFGKKIGIISLYYKTYNYGAQLQSYALVKVLCKMGYDAEQIQFKWFENYVEDAYMNMSINQEEFKKFSENIPHSDVIYTPENIMKTNDCYNVFISGSDQVWGEGIGIAGSATSMMALSFVNEENRKISYAASMGGYLESNNSLPLKETIKRLNFISMREKSAAVQLEREIGRKVESVLDPTLLLKETDWEEISCVPETDKEYILVYNIGLNKNVDELASRIASEHNCEVKNLAYEKGMKVGPLEFIGLIRNAKFVLTDSYHGTIFSILFHKQFLTFAFDNLEGNRSRNTRIEDLLDTLKLKDRYIKNRFASEKDLYGTIDYDMVEIKLRDERNRSIDFLVNAIEKEDTRKVLKEKKKYLLLGETGALGAYVVNCLAEKDVDIFVTSRQKRNDFKNVHYLLGDAHDLNFINRIIPLYPDSKTYDLIIDFMHYSTKEFSQRAEYFLKAASQYIFLSSARVYADSEELITEESSRLLDVLQDSEYLMTDDYPLAKARAEDILTALPYNNYTIVRPYISYAEERLQLGVFEKEYWLRRALLGKNIIITDSIAESYTTLTFAGDVAKGICALIECKSTYGQAIQIMQNNPVKWKEVINVYRDVIKEKRGLDVSVIYVTEEELFYCYPNVYPIIYDRKYNRIFDNKNISKYVDTSKFQEPLIGLRKCLSEFLDGGKEKHPFLSFDYAVDFRIDEVVRRYEINNCKNKDKLGYSTELNIQVLIAMLKEYGIKKVIASPGSSNISFVGSIQYDDYFEIYSCVDERSAAYMACGMAEESGEPVVLSCTGATASRNYMPGLTEAYYKKLPVIAVTSSQNHWRIGRLHPQATDRMHIPTDIAVAQVDLRAIRDDDDFRGAQIELNEALLAMGNNGGGPVHINLEERFNPKFTAKCLPKVHRIRKYMAWDNLPDIPSKEVAIVIGSHAYMSQKLVQLLDEFCEKYNGVVICDHTSGYHGNYKIGYSIIGSQYSNVKETPELVIRVGEISGDYYSLNLNVSCLWRVSEDGKITDVYRRMPDVFEMPFEIFLTKYNNKRENRKSTEFFTRCLERENVLRNRIPELPFSTLYVAQKVSKQIPENVYLQLGILNVLRCFNFFRLPQKIKSTANVGGFGIDGASSTIIGASLTSPDKLHYLITGDLGFFYDLNAIGNREIGKNLRILVINNGCGMEMKLSRNIGYQFGEDGDRFFAASHHYANMSRDFIKDMAKNLGFEYISADNKNDFCNCLDEFLDTKEKEYPMIYEVFTDDKDEKKALDIATSLTVYS